MPDGKSEPTIRMAAGVARGWPSILRRHPPTRRQPPVVAVILREPGLALPAPPVVPGVYSTHVNISPDFAGVRGISDPGLPVHYLGSYYRESGSSSR